MPGTSSRPSSDQGTDTDINVLVGINTRVEHLTATVNDVFYCLSELQSQVEILRQNVAYMRNTESALALMDAEIQLLKGQGQSNQLHGVHEGQLVDLKLLVRDLDTRRANEIRGLQEVIRKAQPDVEFQSSSKAQLEDEVWHFSPPELAVSREDLISRIFGIFDQDLSGTLDQKEMLEFMRARGGFRRDDQEWAKEYENLSLEGDWSADNGINLLFFTELVSDETNIEYHCDDQKLRDVALVHVHEDIKHFQKPVPTVRFADEEPSNAMRPKPKLIEVIRDGNIPMALSLAASVATKELNDMDDFGSSALHLAAERGQVEVCRAIMARQDFDHANSKDWFLGSTPLLVAAFAGQHDACLALLQSPGFQNANDRNCEGNTALHNAAKEGHATVCQTLLDCEDFTQANVDNFDGYTALHLAALNGHVDVCRTLVEHWKFTAENTKTKWGATAAQIAQEGARELLNREVVLRVPQKPRVDIAVTGSRGITPTPANTLPSTASFRQAVDNTSTSVPEGAVAGSRGITPTRTASTTSFRQNAENTSTSVPDNAVTGLRGTTGYVPFRQNAENTSSPVPDEAVTGSRGITPARMPSTASLPQKAENTSTVVPDGAATGSRRITPARAPSTTSFRQNLLESTTSFHV